MTEVLALELEILKSLQAGQAKVDYKLASLDMRLAPIEQRLSALEGRIALMEGEVMSRFDRLERMLGFADDNH